MIQQKTPFLAQPNPACTLVHYYTNLLRHANVIPHTILPRLNVRSWIVSLPLRHILDTRAALPQTLCCAFLTGLLCSPLAPLNRRRTTKRAVTPQNPDSSPHNTPNVTSVTPLNLPQTRYLQQSATAPASQSVSRSAPVKKLLASGRVGEVASMTLQPRFRHRTLCLQFGVTGNGAFWSASTHDG